ncbi:MAG: hypothetical protein M3Y66_06745, partial [Actinomycetota bacterium]|nr:hypothetical protein [Actinomycetota bacterium]
MSDKTERKPLLDLSLTQLIGGSAAAATAAALGSRLGVVGTIVGAALVSVISAIAGAVYTQSLRRTREMVRARELIGARELMMRAGQRTGMQGRTARQAALPGDATKATKTTDAAGVAEVGTAPSVWQRVTWKTVAVTAGVVFLITAAVITGSELVTGRSLD